MRALSLSSNLNKNNKLHIVMTEFVAHLMTSTGVDADFDNGS